MILSSDIFRGHTETMILAILSDGDSYGYEITKNIKEKSEGHCDIRDATIYTAFRRMESDGLISTYWGDGVGGAKRRYYSITEKGRKFYMSKLEEWEAARRILDSLLRSGK
ncbi:MAG: PadR family transcriptional regulator [Clostridia bacterium]|jgi:PadR family transcriptional regulator PadR|nr:PadR family transcriptional regulator [Clostridia bacterium]MCX4366867.1 PadR family transcriptional regulator [Clostridia bacterium]